MSSSDRARGPRQVPPPEGAVPRSAYARFIPREELQGFATWNPESLGESGAAKPAAGGVSRPEPAPAPRSAEDLQAEVQARLKEARQAGYQDGYRDGLVALESFKRSFAQQMTAQITDLLASLEQRYDSIEQEMAQCVAETAVQLARQVVRSELVQRPELVAQVAAEAVNAIVSTARHLRVRVHPQDHALVSEGASEALQLRTAQLVSDAGIQRGGCVVESDLGQVDARVESRWAQAAAVYGSQLPLQADEVRA